MLHNKKQGGNKNMRGNVNSGPRGGHRGGYGNRNMNGAPSGPVVGHNNNNNTPYGHLSKSADVGSNSSSHSNLSPAAANEIDGIYKNSHFLHTVTSLIGSMVRFTALDGKVYEGILKTFSSEFELALLSVVEVMNNNNKSESDVKSKIFINDIQNVVASLENKRPLEDMVVKLKDLVKLEVVEADLEYAAVTKKSVLTDGEISKVDPKNHSQERQLVEWNDTDGDTLDTALGNSSFSNNGGGWGANEMIEYNQKKYNIKSTFDNDLYSIPLEQRDDDEFRKQQAHAEAVAREIEGDPDRRNRLALENELDEETRYSAVVTGKRDYELGLNSKPQDVQPRGQDDRRYNNVVKAGAGRGHNLNRNNRNQGPGKGEMNWREENRLNQQQQQHRSNQQQQQHHHQQQHQQPHQQQAHPQQHQSQPHPQQHHQQVPPHQSQHQQQQHPPQHQQQHQQQAPPPHQQQQQQPPLKLTKPEPKPKPELKLKPAEPELKLTKLPDPEPKLTKPESELKLNKPEPEPKLTKPEPKPKEFKLTKPTEPEPKLTKPSEPASKEAPTPAAAAITPASPNVASNDKSVSGTPATPQGTASASSEHQLTPQTPSGSTVSSSGSKLNVNAKIFTPRAPPALAQQPQNAGGPQAPALQPVPPAAIPQPMQAVPQYYPQMGPHGQNFIPIQAMSLQNARHMAPNMVPSMPYQYPNPQLAMAPQFLPHNPLTHNPHNPHNPVVLYPQPVPQQMPPNPNVMAAPQVAPPPHHIQQGQAPNQGQGQRFRGKGGPNQGGQQPDGNYLPRGGQGQHIPPPQQQHVEAYQQSQQVVNVTGTPIQMPGPQGYQQPAPGQIVPHHPQQQMQPVQMPPQHQFAPFPYAPRYNIHPGHINLTGVPYDQYIQ